jgi:hypothetical protein
VILTAEQKAQAEELGLTYTEMHLALKCRVAPAVYAAGKRKRQVERAEWEARLAMIGGELEGRLPEQP